MIVAMDTSSALTSVAVVDGNHVVAAEAELDSRRHAEVLAPLLARVLRTAGVGARDVDLVACGVGPGPYTGLRVGIASARAVGLAWDRPVVGICSLDALAAAVVDSGVVGSFGVACDARRREVYWAWYDETGERAIGPHVERPEDIDSSLRAGAWWGHGAAEHEGNFASVAGATEELLYPSADWVGRRAGRLIAAGQSATAMPVVLAAHGGDGDTTATALAGRSLLTPEPLYLRRPDAAEAKPVPPLNEGSA